MVDGHISLVGVVAPKHVVEVLNIALVIVQTQDQLTGEEIVTDLQGKHNDVELDTVQVGKSQILKRQFFLCYYDVTSYFMIYSRNGRLWRPTLVTGTL